MILKPLEDPELRNQYFLFEQDGSDVMDIAELIAPGEPWLRIVDDLTVCRANIIVYLLHCSHLHQQREPFDFVMSWAARSKYIRIWYDEQHVLTITDFADKFNQNFSGNWDDAKVLEGYDTERQSTFGQDSRHRFYRILSRIKQTYHGHISYDLRFPEPADVSELYMWEQAKKRISGVQFCKPGIYKQSYLYDIHASYPSTIYDNLLPKDNGHYIKAGDPIPARYWTLWHLVVHSAKARGYDYFELDGADELDVFLAENVVNRLEEFYEIKFDKIDGYAYKLHATPYITQFYDETLLATALKVDPLYKQYSKGIGNSLIGSFGAKYEYVNYFYSLEARALRARCFTSYAPRRSYMPIYIYALSRAKLNFIDLIKTRPGIVYANTDGYITTEQQSHDWYNAQKHETLGRVRQQQQFKKLCVRAIGDYCGTTSDGETYIKLNGRIPPHDLTLEEYIGGYVSSARQLNSLGLIERVPIIEPPFDPLRPSITPFLPIIDK